VDGKGFVAAASLGVGTSIVTRAGPSLTVTAVQEDAQPGGYAVYNFVVPGDHTYFVGNLDGGAWVHNPAECNPALPFDDLPESSGPVHGNNASSQRPGHVYEILDENGETHKFGESGDGLRRDGKSIRAEKQARQLTRERGKAFSSRIVAFHPDKASSLQHERQLIRAYERQYDHLPPGNEGYR